MLSSIVASPLPALLEVKQLYTALSERTEKLKVRTESRVSPATVSDIVTLESGSTGLPSTNHTTVGL